MITIDIKGWFKKIIKGRSILMILVTLLECILSIVVTLSFVYRDSASYSNNIVSLLEDVDKLLQTMFSQTWWALILVLFAFIAITNLTGLVYKKMEYHFMSIMIWICMMVVAINFNNSLSDNLWTLAMFVPILIISKLAFNNQRNAIEKEEVEELIELEKKNKKKSIKKDASK